MFEVRVNRMLQQTTSNRFERGIVSAPQIGTRQMVNHRYGVCIRMALGYCSIEWSQTDMFSFSVSGDTGLVFDPDIIGKT